MKRIDVIGQVFGRLTAINNEPHSSEGKARVRCSCTCGNEIVVEQKSLRRSLTKSCGCLRKEKMTQGLRYKDGRCDRPEYRVWKNIKTRCFNPNSKSWKDYGAKGITMCDRWKEDFAAFFEDMGERPSKDHSIERRDNKDGYNPDNCSWGTRTEQNNNQERNRIIEWNGQQHTIAEWCRLHNAPYQRTRDRVALGWSLHDALNFPASPGRLVRSS